MGEEEGGERDRDREEEREGEREQAAIMRSSFDLSHVRIEHHALIAVSK